MEKWIDWFETDTFIVCVANAITAYPSVQKQMDELYSSNKYRFYEAARNSSAYTHLLMPKGRLSEEVSTKRNLGVLLVAQSDSIVLENVKRILLLVHPALKGYLKNPYRNTAFESQVFERSKGASSGANKALALLHITVYLFYKTYSEKAIESALCKGEAAFIERYSSLEVSHYEKQAKGDELPLSTILECYKFSPEDWKYLRSFLKGSYINRLRESKRRGELLKKHGINPIPELDGYSDYEEKNELIRAASAFCHVMSKADISWEEIAGDNSISKDDQKRILHACVELSAIEGGFRPHHYLAAYIIYSLCLEMKSMRDFYWRNNAETQFLEAQHLLEENLVLKQQLAELELRLESALREKDIIQTGHRKTATTTEHELMTVHRLELDCQQRRVAELERQLAEQSLELEALRKLALNVDLLSDFPLQELEDFNATIEGKKIIIIGGHVNWRKKLEHEYPTLMVFDGTNTIIDLKLLDNADMVFLYTFNMSHKVYERVISYARQYGVPLSYLPRVTNTELIEKHIYLTLQNEG